MENDQSIEDRLNRLAGPVGDSCDSCDSEDREGAPSAGALSAGEPEDDGGSLDPAVCQHVVRSQANGQDVLSGQFRVQMAAGQSVGVLHVPIYPPMEAVPVVEAFVEANGEGDAVRVRVTEAQRFGVRLELKVPPAEEARSEVITVVFTAG